MQAKRNASAKTVGQAKAAGKDIVPLLKDIEMLGDELNANEQALADVQNQLNEMIWAIPNILHASVPDGLSEEDNAEVRRWGEPKTFDFKPKDHVALGEQLGWMDFETATKISVSRFVVLYEPLSRMHRALIQFMLDVHTKEHGYQ